MAAKIKCPGCGAKNEATAHRCRICTAVINPGAAPAAVEEPAAPVGIDHFDPNEIDRQVRPARERFDSGGGALSARLAAVSGAPTELPRDDRPMEPAADVPPPDLDEAVARDPVPETAPIEYEDEPFDPDALFRDMR